MVKLTILGFNPIFCTRHFRSYTIFYKAKSIFLFTLIPYCLGGGAPHLSTCPAYHAYLHVDKAYFPFSVLFHVPLGSNFVWFKIQCLIPEISVVIS